MICLKIYLIGMIVTGTLLLIDAARPVRRVSRHSFQYFWLDVILGTVLWPLQCGLWAAFLVGAIDPNE